MAFNEKINGWSLERSVVVCLSVCEVSDHEVAIGLETSNEEQRSETYRSNSLNSIRAEFSTLEDVAGYLMAKSECDVVNERTPRFKAWWVCAT